MRTVLGPACRAHSSGGPVLGIRLIYLMDRTPMGTLYAVAAGTGNGASERIHHFDQLPQVANSIFTATTCTRLPRISPLQSLKLQRNHVSPMAGSTESTGWRGGDALDCPIVVIIKRLIYTSLGSRLIYRPPTPVWCMAQPPPPSGSCASTSPRRSGPAVRCARAVRGSVARTASPTRAVASTARCGS